MSRGKASGISLYKNDVRVVLGMEARGDRNHDIAAWFGVNQGRIAEAKNGDYGVLEAAPASELPPSGAPGIKGRRLREAVRKALILLGGGKAEGADQATTLLEQAVALYDKNEG